MKLSKAQAHSRVHRIPRLAFTAERRLTSYAGLVIFQALFQRLNLKERLRHCFAHLTVQPIFGFHSILLVLIVHLLLGFRRLRGLDVYRHDPLVARVVGLRRLPDVSTVSRALSLADHRSIADMRSLCRDLVTERLSKERFPRVTLDFDGSVQSTTGHAEGTAVGFNKVKKGARSYYPLYCTIAQTSQFLDLYHRPGNVHDSNGAKAFMKACIDGVRQASPSSKLEARTDAAFFDHVLLDLFDDEGVDFSCSVPFERFPVLKRMIEERTRWQRLDRTWSYFETDWRPKSWPKHYRVICLRQRRPKQRKGPLQLDLFVPRDFEYEYKAIVTNRSVKAGSMMSFHHGRGAQEKLFGEAKQHVALDLVATRTLHGNQAFTLAGMLAHNLSRELQMQTLPRHKSTHPNRTAQWDFAELGTIRQRLLHLAGHLTRPQGELTLTLNDNPFIRDALHRYLQGAPPSG